MQYSIQPPRTLALILILALGLLLSTATKPGFAAETYQNTGQITFLNPSSSPPNLPEIAMPYPSTIEVSGLSGSITKVTVIITGFRHTFPNSVDLLLIGPDGKQVLLMSDAGGGTADPPPTVNLTFTDDAAQPLSSGSIATGVYRPSNYAPNDTFPTPGPGALGPTPNLALSVFNLTNPNGSWRLFAVEDTSGTSGSIDGWSLQIETADLATEVSSAQPSVDAGTTLTYNVTVHNYGTEAVGGPTVTIDIPTGTSFSSVTPPAGWDCPASPGATSFTCTTASFPRESPSAPAPVITVNVQVSEALAVGTPITPRATISSAVPEADSTNNSATATINVTTLADLSVALVDSPDPVNAGAPLTLAVAATNSGPSNAANPQLTIPIPASTTFVSLTQADGWSCATPAPDGTGNIICTRDVFSITTNNFSLVIKANPDLGSTATINSSGSISSDTADNNLTNNSDADTTSITTATDLEVTVTSAPDPVSAAANLDYTIVVTNKGPSNAASTTLATAVRSGTTFVSLETPAGWTCSAPPIGSIGPVSCTNDSFGVTTATFHLTVQVLSGTPVGTVLTHESSVSSSTPETIVNNNSATDTTGVTVNADLAVTQAGVGTEVKVGTTLTYQIRVNNSGPEPAEAVTLTTGTPQHTTLVTLQAPAGWNCPTLTAGFTGSITCTHPALDVTTNVLELKVLLAKVPTGTSVPFSATVQSTTEDGAPANNTVSLDSRAVPPFRSFLPSVRR